jgi:hypothetical protein
MELKLDDEDQYVFDLAVTKLMPKIAGSIVRITDARTREQVIHERLSTPIYAYFSTLKSLWPIFLGLGIGIRVTRTHYDAKTEKEKRIVRKEIPLRVEDGEPGGG